MRIAIDARAWNWTGVGRYIRALVQEYAQIDHAHTFTLLMPNDADAIAEAKQIIHRAPEKFALQVVDGSYYSWAEQFALPLKLARVQADLFHFPHFNVPLVFQRPYVVTIHDTTRFYFPGQKRQGMLQQVAYEQVFTRAVRSAQQVICVSEHTANELQSLLVLRQPRVASLGGPPGTASSEAEPSDAVARGNAGETGPAALTIHEGVDETFFSKPSDEDARQVHKLIGTNDPYLLMVGVWMSHKNIPRTLKAFQLAQKKHPNIKLVITGRHKPGYVNVPMLAQELGLARSVILPGFVPDTLLPALYSGARGLVFASLYEGFGLPALEAAATGVPVVSSNVSSLPEVLGEAAVYVNPEDAVDISRGMEEVIIDLPARDQLIHTGKLRARQFSWKKCAEETLRAYEVQ